MTKDIYDWNGLIEDIKTFGTRNSLLTALMPTAGTSQIMKCYESFEPYMSNVFVRTTIAGEYIVINENLVRELIKRDLWNEDLRKKIIIANGSVQNIDEIPNDIKEVYKSAFEIKLKSIIKQSIERGAFIDQSQSMNLFMQKPDPSKLTSAHFYGWKGGLKTGMYYLRSTSAVNPLQFGIDINEIIRLTGKSNPMELIQNDYGLNKKEEPEVKICKFIPGKSAEGCLMCSS
ncbi:ribonucleoside-diphosphate reductase subunit alpha [Candidatus Woesearchaeota archaeon]|nr:ribonucleoside-diphosphate reductase subunit alpha [Candidatus Woesearchaeota archaeon]